MKPAARQDVSEQQGGEKVDQSTIDQDNCFPVRVPGDQWGSRVPIC